MCFSVYTVIGLLSFCINYRRHKVLVLHEVTIYVWSHSVLHWSIWCTAARRHKSGKPLHLDTLFITFTLHLTCHPSCVSQCVCVWRRKRRKKAGRKNILIVCVNVYLYDSVGGTNGGTQRWKECVEVFGVWKQWVCVYACVCQCCSLRAILTSLCSSGHEGLQRWRTHGM